MKRTGYIILLLVNIDGVSSILMDLIIKVSNVVNIYTTYVLI